MPNLPDANIPQIGYFLDFSYWQSAIKLLKYQLKIRAKNKHFNTLSMFYYERLDGSVEKLEEESYFSQRVANNLFYGLENEFSINQYPVPKANLGLRNYKFFTYPMRVLYYSIALYLVHLSQDLRQDYHSGLASVRAEYGGKCIDQGDDET